MNDPAVTASVLNWNSAEDTIRCVKSLQELRFPNLDIVIVDNASTDDSIERLEGTLCDVTLIRTSSNLGYAAGHSYGLRHAQETNADLVWLLNNDLYVPLGTLTTLIAEYAKRGSGLYSAVPLKASEDTALADCLVSFDPKFMNLPYREFPFGPLFRKKFARLFPDLRTRSVAALPGSNLLIPLEVVRKHGFLDTSFFMYGEEIDYCFRLRDAGKRLWLVPTCVVFHEEAGSSRTSNRLGAVMRYYRTRNQLRRVLTHNGWGTLLAVLTKDILQALAVLIKQDRDAAELTAIGIRDALIGVTGKTIAPEAITAGEAQLSGRLSRPPRDSRQAASEDTSAQ